MTQQQVAHASWHYRPGEMVVATELPRERSIHQEVHGLVRDTVQQQLGGVFHSQQRRRDAVVFHAPDRPPLAFLFYDLAETSHEYVKHVVSSIHANQLATLEPVRGRGLNPVGVMPHWLGSAQQDYTDGSPASDPQPIQPRRGGRLRYHYTRRDGGGQPANGPAVPVLILDTSPNMDRAERQAARFREHNAQLTELVELLRRKSLPAWHAMALDEYERALLPLAKGPGGRRGDRDISDHALFVAGLIHDLAPGADLHMRPVLNRLGVGDLHLLLRVLADVIEEKDDADPLVVNMSLGFAPKLEHLPWIWHGVTRPHDPEFVGDVPIPGEAHDVRSMARARQHVDETTRLLHAGLERLSEYLLANNCLGVAAAGNDSRWRVEHGRTRLGPRIPARYPSILGVAATLVDHAAPADYSNAGAETEYGDHIATFGGDTDQDGQPRDGVIGVYTEARADNTAGWAMWSGTSFATALAAGLVSSYWGARPGARADEVLLDFNDSAETYVPALRTMSIGMSGDWQTVSSE